MDKKYVLIKPFECQYGTLPEGTEIILFREQFYVNGGPIPQSFNGIFERLIKDKNYVKELKMIKNEI